MTFSLFFYRTSEQSWNKSVTYAAYTAFYNTEYFSKSVSEIFAG